MKTILIASFLCQILCAHESHIPWSDEKSALGNIEIREAQAGEIENVIEVPGKIVFDPNLIAFVIPKVNGVVRTLDKNIGDFVKENEVLATIESKEIAEAKANYLANLKRYEQKLSLLKSEESLKGISPKVDLLNAKLDAEESALMLDLSRQNLYSLGLNKEEIDQLSSQRCENLRIYQIKSPICGQVVQRNITLGELIFDTGKIFTIANFDRVWIELALSQCDVCFLKQDLPMTIISPQGKEMKAILYQFQPTIDEETRRAIAFGVLNNEKGIWKVGEYVTAKIQTDIAYADVMVPKSAIQNVDGENVVFIKDSEGFSISPVRLGKMDDENVEILSGLEKGQFYAAMNSFVIKADIEKDEAEH